jgi:hypothetical protein
MQTNRVQLASDVSDRERATRDAPDHTDDTDAEECCSTPPGDGAMPCNAGPTTGVVR